MLVDPLYNCDKAAHRALILRRTMPELRDLIAKSQQLYPKAFPGAKWREQEKEWRFPSGARVEFGYAENMLDVLRYQGQSYCVAAGTLIRMADGTLRPIQNIVVGDLVATLEGARRVTHTMQPRIDFCVAAFVRDSSGTLGLQVHPAKHPLLTSVSLPYESSEYLCQTSGRLPTYQTVWQSYTQTLGFHPENQDSFSSLVDVETCCEDVAQNNQEVQMLPWSSSPVVLAQPLPLSSSFSHKIPIQYYESCKSLLLSLGIDLETSSQQLGLLQLASLFQSQQDHNLLRTVCDDVEGGQTETRKVLGFLYDCLAYYHSYDEQLPLCQAAAQDGALALDGVEQLGHDNPLADEMDCILSDNHYQPLLYIHPYTQERRHVVIPVELHNSHVVPLGNLLVYDLTVDRANHYIDATGFVNKNTWIGVDELPQFPTSDVWTFLSSSLRSVDPSIKPVMRACVDEGDVLTVDGWRAIQDIQIGDYVYGLTSSGETVARQVTETFCFPITEPLVKIRKKNLYASMTKDHRVVYRKFGSSKFEITRWNEHDGRSIDLARGGTSYYGPGYVPPVGAFDPLSYAEFLGLFVAEGSTSQRGYHYKVVVTQNKEENHEFVWRVMRASGMSVCYSNNGDFQITNKELFNHLRPLGKAHQKRFPRAFLNGASREQLELAFRAYALGDGHWQSPSSVMLYTSSPQLRDDLQEICAKLGYKTQTSHKTHDNPRWNDQYTIYVTINGPTTKVDKAEDGRNDVVLEDYSGNVYCITVDEINNFYLRQRGCVWVSGNTGNPGNIGSTWVKEMFIDPAPSNTKFEVPVKVTTPRGVIETVITRKYIPATVFDNPFLTYDNSYIAMLASLPEMQRRQFLEGDWDAFDNAAFPDFKRSIHVLPATTEIPTSWIRFRAADWGYSSPACCLWFAVDYDNNLYVYRELYTRGKNAEEFARLVLDAEYNEPIRYGVLDSSVWAKRGDVGPSIAETMIRAGCKWRPADRSPNSRKAGKLEIHRRLSTKLDVDGNETPSVYILENCRNLIRTLPLLPLDPNDPEDIDTKAEDHAYDAFRYGVMSRPMSTEVMFDNTNPARVHDFVAASNTFGY